MKITYYTNGKIEILVIKDNNGKHRKKRTVYHWKIVWWIFFLIRLSYVMILFLDIELKTKIEIMRLLEQCSDYLHNDIQKIIEEDFSFIFRSEIPVSEYIH